jgi:RNA polymerase sigma-70 factor (ECF subfamily)
VKPPASSPASAFDPAELCARILRGDPAAEAELIDRFLPRVRTMVSVRMNDPESVDDLSQSIMLAALCSLRTEMPRNPEILPSFLFGIARNFVNDHFRRRGRERTEDLAAAESIPDSPIKAREREMIEDAKREIGRLDAPDREVLELTLTEGLEPNEIAERLGLPGATVRQRKSRAMKRLLERLSRAKPVTKEGRGATNS